MPLQHNGLGYNNLINIYMLIKLTEIQKGRDFRILCLEEPEAHLHPAMQYKLFKYLRDLDQANDLNQQIFVTTHSSNISAVAGIDNMFMLAYNREGETEDCRQQSLYEQFKDQDNTTCKTEAKAHLTKFLDVTRSDMLFADKVILVEGIAENFNTEIQKAEYIDFRQTILGIEFKISIFDELDRDRLIEAVNGLFWGTSYKLFKQVFSDDSKYMNVHQAKGLEWDKVVVSVTPSKRDKVKISSLYSSPCLTNESSADEFTRMYYVACSRAKEDLYIHIPSGCTESDIKSSIDAFCINSGQKIEYEFIR